MAQKPISQKSYFELAEHNLFQAIIFALMTMGGIYLVFILMLPFLQTFFESFLHGVVHNKGIAIPYYIDSNEPLTKTSYFFAWGVDIYLKTPQEARYWFNPFISLFLQSSIIGLALSICISSILSQKFGFMRQKIEREIAYLVNKVAMAKYGYQTADELEEIANEVIHADLKELQNFVDEGSMSLEDMKCLHKALIWRNSGIFYRILHINDGLTIYMRFYFTVRYNNTVLGLVYIGAAVLIIIIGLRGLKFIPPTQPSLVLFALGLEFSLLITYAFTLMYSKQDEETDGGSFSRAQDTIYMSSDYGSSREIEKLLRVFIKSRDLKKKGK